MTQTTDLPVRARTQTGKSNQTLDQRRAAHAWNCVQQAKNRGDKQAKEYGTHAKKLPTRIMAAGLGSALAFVLAKAGAKEHKAHIGKLHDDLTDWVICKRGIKGRNPRSLLESVIQGDRDFLRRATDEALAYLVWLNRFADAQGLTKED